MKREEEGEDETRKEGRWNKEGKEEEEGTRKEEISERGEGEKKEGGWVGSGWRCCRERDMRWK